jgi:hypothetical protein
MTRYTFIIGSNIIPLTPNLSTGWVVYLNGLGLWCLTLLSTIFQLYCGGLFEWKGLQISKAIIMSINVKL